MTIYTALIALAACAQADELRIDANGTALELDIRRLGAAAYVPLQPAADAFNAKLEPLPDGSLNVCIDQFCVNVRLDGSDRRVLQTERGVYASASRLPELLDAHFGWNETAQTPALLPGAAPTRSIQPGEQMPRHRPSRPGRRADSPFQLYRQARRALHLGELVRVPRQLARLASLL